MSVRFSGNNAFDAGPDKNLEASRGMLIIFIIDDYLPKVTSKT